MARSATLHFPSERRFKIGYKNGCTYLLKLIARVSNLQVSYRINVFNECIIYKLIKRCDSATVISAYNILYEKS